MFKFLTSRTGSNGKPRPKSISVIEEREECHREECDLYRQHNGKSNGDIKECDDNEARRDDN